VIQSSLEAQQDVARRGFATFGVATFVDVARAWDRPDTSASLLHVDVGAGLRVHLAPGQPAIRIDFAHGLRDGRNAVSAGWQLSR
jgi:outer membrane translocation and assembly module TamA